MWNLTISPWWISFFSVNFATLAQNLLKCDSLQMVVTRRVPLRPSSRNNQKSTLRCQTFYVRCISQRVIAMSSLNWSELFGIHFSIAELIVHGSAIDFFLFLVFRFVLHRDVGALGVADILLLVIVSDAAQNAMAGEYKSISEGFILIATIIGWNVLLDWLAFRYPAFAKFAQPSTRVGRRDVAQWWLGRFWFHCTT